MEAKAFPSCTFLEMRQRMFFLSWSECILKNVFKMIIMQGISAVHQQKCTPSKSRIYSTPTLHCLKIPQVHHHNPPQKPNPILHRSKLQTALTQKMKMKKMPLKTVKMTYWMSRTRRMMKRRLLIARKTSWKTAVERRQKCWEQIA